MAQNGQAEAPHEGTSGSTTATMVMIVDEQQKTHDHMQLAVVAAPDEPAAASGPRRLGLLRTPPVAVGSSCGPPLGVADSYV